MPKQCRSRSVGFWRSQLILIFTVCKGRAYPGSAGQGLTQSRLKTLLPSFIARWWFGLPYQWKLNPVHFPDGLCLTLFLCDRAHYGSDSGFRLLWCSVCNRTLICVWPYSSVIGLFVVQIETFVCSDFQLVIELSSVFHSCVEKSTCMCSVLIHWCAD